MKVTNKLNLPSCIVKAVEDKRPFDELTYSVTEILNPVRQITLRRRYRLELEEDVSDRIWAMLGTATHYIMEKNAGGNSLSEERLDCKINGYKLSGQFDLFEDGIISDLKVTSVWTIIYGSRTKEWEEQQNLYAHLLWLNGFEVKGLQIITLLRDWSKTKAKIDPSYPQSQVHIVKLNLWSEEKVAAFIVNKFEQIEKALDLTDDNLPECTPEQRWSTGDKWAIKKDGRKSAVKLHTSLESAEEHLLALDNKHSIEFRQGEDKRCIDYCSCNKFCTYYKEHYEI